MDQASAIVQSSNAQPIEPLASRLEGLSGRLGNAATIARRILQDAQADAKPGGVGANGWYMDCSSQANDLIVLLERIEAELGTL